MNFPESIDVFIRELTSLVHETSEELVSRRARREKFEEQLMAILPAMISALSQKMGGSAPIPAPALVLVALGRFVRSLDEEQVQKLFTMLRPEQVLDVTTMVNWLRAEEEKKEDR